MVVLRRDINRAKAVDFLPLKQEESEDEDDDDEPTFRATGSGSDLDVGTRQRNSGTILKDSDGKPIA
jgi:hypothetical protein